MRWESLNGVRRSCATASRQGIYRVAPDLGRHKRESADVDMDRAVDDLGRIGAEVDEHGSAERLAAGVVKAPVVLGALDDIAHDQAIAEQRLLMGAVAIGGVVSAVRGAVYRVGVAAVIEGNDVLGVNVAGRAGSDPLGHRAVSLPAGPGQAAVTGASGSARPSFSGVGSLNGAAPGSSSRRT